MTGRDQKQVLSEISWMSPMMLRGENTLPVPGYYYNFFFPPNKLNNFVKEGKQLNNLSPKPENHPSADAPIWDHLRGLQIINL